MFLFVNLAAVRNPCHVNCLGGVINFVHGPVIANANPPFLITALEFFAARRPWSLCQSFQTRYNAGNHFGGQPMQFFSALAVNET